MAWVISRKSIKGSSGALPEEGPGLLCVLPQKKAKFQSECTNLPRERHSSRESISGSVLATHLASPIKKSIKSCGLEMLVLGLIFMAYLAWQDHKQHKGTFQNLSKGLHVNLCAMSALQWRRELL